MEEFTKLEDAHKVLRLEIGALRKTVNRGAATLAGILNKPEVDGNRPDPILTRSASFS